jgi:hypothetical protein
MSAGAERRCGVVAAQAGDKKTGSMLPELYELEPQDLQRRGAAPRRGARACPAWECPGREEDLLRACSSIQCPPLGSCCFFAQAVLIFGACVCVNVCAHAARGQIFLSFIAMANGQSVEHAMQYLQEVEKELPEGEFAEFLNIIDDFKSNRCISGAVRLFPRGR